MFPKMIAEEKKTNEVDTQINIEASFARKLSKLNRNQIALSFVTTVLVISVVGSVVLYYRYADMVDDTEIVYRTSDDDGLKHSIEITTKNSDRVETVVFEKIHNVTEGGTLIYDFRQKLVAAYSDKDNACYLWEDDSLDWNDRGWLHNGEFPSVTFKREEEIPSAFLRRVAVNEIADKCFGVKSYWATLLSEDQSRTVESGKLSRNKRDIYILCVCSYRTCDCVIFEA
ncbi:uncharacterized protein [Antedon mediterranea]|uniref:uncharacterized protein n=1 Tax=Antedon mediterranea TaxID=105859 RepID=UPI003AF4CEB1